MPHHCPHFVHHLSLRDVSECIEYLKMRNYRRQVNLLRQTLNHHKRGRGNYELEKVAQYYSENNTKASMQVVALDFVNHKVLDHDFIMQYREISTITCTDSNMGKPTWTGKACYSLFAQDMRTIAKTVERKRLSMCLTITSTSKFQKDNGTCGSYIPYSINDIDFGFLLAVSIPTYTLLCWVRAAFYPPGTTDSSTDSFFTELKSFSGQHGTGTRASHTEINRGNQRKGY